MLHMNVDAVLQAYGELAVKVGLNLQQGQRLMIVGPSVAGGASLEAAPLVRAIAASAYRAGAPLVEAVWGDEALQLLRLQHAPRDSFSQFSAWLSDALVQHVEAGHAVISVYANNPDLLKDAPPQLIGEMQSGASLALRTFREHIGRNQTNWTVVAAAGAGWAAKVFPHLRPDEQKASLWEAIARLCRL